MSGPSVKLQNNYELCELSPKSQNQQNMEIAVNEETIVKMDLIARVRTAYETYLGTSAILMSALRPGG